MPRLNCSRIPFRTDRAALAKRQLAGAGRGNADAAAQGAAAGRVNLRTASSVVIIITLHWLAVETATAFAVSPNQTLSLEEKLGAVG